MEISYGKPIELRSSPRYFWNNAKRGNYEFVIIQYTQKGEGLFRIGEREYPVPAGHAFIAIVPEDSQYQYPAASKDDWEFGWINFEGHMTIRLWRELRAQFGPVIPLPPRSRAVVLFEELTRRVASARFEDRFSESLAAYEFYLEVWRQLSGDAPPEANLLEFVSFQCRNHLSKALTVKELADRARMSREHFSRLFRIQTGHTPARYLRDFRLSEARKLIASTRLSRKEVAIRCGFFSSRQLSDLLRRQKNQKKRPSS